MKKKENKKGETWRMGYITGFNEALQDAGGCTYCWGKGYVTVRFGTRGAPDFEGDKEYITPQKTHMRFCSCSRGKQLKTLLKK